VHREGAPTDSLIHLSSFCFSCATASVLSERLRPIRQSPPLPIPTESASESGDSSSLSSSRLNFYPDSAPGMVVSDHQIARA
ncbi:hypothetical protein TorRG33x02_168570, partial [Trema orientale]